MGRLRELVLWAGAALGLLAVAAGLAVSLGGCSFLVFRSGSMSPEIPTGGLALARTVPAADLRAGDVVSVTAASGERITHRVVTTTLRGDTASLVLKGDANATADAEVYQVTSAERVVASVPVGGYVVAHALTPPGLVALAALSLMLLVLSGGRPPADDDVDETDERTAPRLRRLRPRHRQQVPLRRRLLAGGALAVSVVAVVAGGGAAVARTTGTLATYTDRGSATASGTAYRLAAPTTTCADGSTSLTFTFPAVTMPGRTTTYDAVVTGGTSPVTLTPSGTGTTRTVTVTSTQAPGALASTRNYLLTVTARAAAASGPVWTSTAGYSFSTYGTIFVDMSCGAAT